MKRLDYTETFAPMVKMVTVHTTPTIVASCGWHIHQLDVNNGNLSKDIYMQLKLGFG